MERYEIARYLIPGHFQCLKVVYFYMHCFSRVPKGALCNFQSKCLSKSSHYTVYGSQNQTSGIAHQPHVILAAEKIN
jgi:hypothetical protein